MYRKYGQDFEPVGSGAEDTLFMVVIGRGRQREPVDLPSDGLIPKGVYLPP